MKEAIKHSEQLYINDLEQASNSYLMAVVTLITGLPLPIISLIASLGYYIAHKKSSYFVRWHSLQTLLAQCLVIPFNSFALAWTLSLIINNTSIQLISLQGESTTIYNHGFFGGSVLNYVFYLLFIILINTIEFIATIYTASRVRRGINVRWFLIADLTDYFCSKQNTDPYRI